jgi:hypothetical protein
MPLDDAPLTFQSGLLPSNAPRARKVRSAAMALPEALWQDASRVGDIKIDVPDAAVPFLIYELGLEPVTEYVADLRRVLADGRAWQRIRGTPASFDLAFGWVDAPPALLEDDATDTWWDLFQLGFDQPLPSRLLAQVIGLARLSKPAHTDVIRIYSHDYDLRAAKTDVALLDGPWLLDDWSGRWVRPDWPKISFGSKTIAVSDVAMAGPVASLERRTRLATFERTFGFVLDVDRADSATIADPLFGAAAIHTRTHVGSTDFGDRGPWADTGWTDGPYGASSAFQSWSLERDVEVVSTPGLVNFESTAIYVHGLPPTVTTLSPPAVWADGPWLDAGYLGELPEFIPL